MMRICLLLLLFPIFTGCETTPKEEELIPEDEAITIPSEDLEPIATFVFDTRRVIAFIAELSKGTYFNLMDQYHPAGQVVRRPEQYAEIGRRSSSAEVREAEEIAREEGLYRFA